MIQDIGGYLGVKIASGVVSCLFLVSDYIKFVKVLFCNFAGALYIN